MIINGLSMPKSRFGRWVLIHLAVIGFVWMAIGAVQLVSVGQGVEQRVRELEKQAATLDKTDAQTNARIDVNTQRLTALEKINLEQRLSTLEAHSETNRTLLIGISISIATLLVEMIGRTLRSLRKKGKGGSDGNND